ncbi:hypothetical protein MRX96_035654 [Rhipicephalus microplus]
MMRIRQSTLIGRLAWSIGAKAACVNSSYTLSSKRTTFKRATGEIDAVNKTAVLAQPPTPKGSALEQLVCHASRAGAILEYQQATRSQSRGRLREPGRFPSSETFHATPFSTSPHLSMRSLLNARMKTGPSRLEQERRGVDSLKGSRPGRKSETAYPSRRNVYEGACISCQSQDQTKQEGEDQESVVKTTGKKGKKKSRESPLVGRKNLDHGERLPPLGARGDGHNQTALPHNLPRDHVHALKTNTDASTFCASHSF